MAKDIKVALELDTGQFNRSISQSKQQVSSFEKSSTGSLGNIKSAFLALGGAAILQNIVSIGQTFQDLQTSLDFVTGSADAGRAAFDNLTRLATVTQFGVEELVQTFIRLKGAGIEPTNDLLLTFADTASLAQDQLGVLTALTELFARGATKGKLELEDFNKIAERGVDVFRPLTKEFNMSIKEIQELAKTAEGQERLFAGIQKALDDTYGGALQDKLKNSSVAFSNLEIASRRLANAIFTELGLGSTTAIEGLTDAINRLADNGETLRKIFVGLVTVVAFIFNPFQKLGLALGAVSRGFGSLFKGTGPLSRVFTQLKNNTANFFDVFKSRAAAFFGFGTNTAKNSKVLKGLNETIDQGTGKILAYGSAVTAAVIANNQFSGSVDDAFVGPPLPPGFRDPPGGDDDTSETIETTKDKVREFLDTLKTKLVNLQNFNAAMAEVEKTFGDDKTVQGIEDYKRAVKGVESAFEDVVDPIKKAKEEQEELAKIQRELAEKLEQGRTAIQLFTDKFTEQAFTTERLNELQSELNALLSEYPELADDVADAQDRLNKAFSDNEALNSFLDTLGQAQKTLSDDLAEALIEGEDAGKAFKDFFKTLVTQLIADALRLAVIQPILSAIFGVNFGAGGGVDSLTGGGLLGALGFAANGGPIMANRPYIVGERGPELMVPGQSGTMIPNNMLGGGSTNITYNINAVDAPSFQQLVARDPEFIYSVTRAGARRLPGQS